MELIDKKKLRDSLVREQARYILSDRMTDKHISAGFMLAIVELDCQPIVMTIDEEKNNEVEQDRAVIQNTAG